MEKNKIYVKARKSQLHCYRDVKLYTQVDKEKYVLYKPSGMTLGEMRVSMSLHPETLFIRSDEKIKGLQEAQKAFNKKLEVDVKKGDTEKIRETLVTIAEETFLEPRSGSLEGVSGTVDILISDYSKENGIINKLIDISSTDYTTVLHSINVMTFSLAFAVYLNMALAEIKKLGLAALLHDIGKTKVPSNILTAPRKLTSEEYEIMKSHTVLGCSILEQCDFKIIEISQAAREHHERIDGSGYPDGVSDISRISQIIGLVDCYEALTTDDRPYRNAIGGFDTFDQILKDEILNGKFDLELCSLFIKSLGG